MTTPQRNPKERRKSEGLTGKDPAVGGGGTGMGKLNLRSLPREAIDDAKHNLSRGPHDATCDAQDFRDKAPP